MSNFVLSGFGDEIDASLDVQMEVMAGLGIRHIELRGVDARSIAAFNPREAAVLRRRMDAKGFKVSALGSPYGKIGIMDEFEPHLVQFKVSLEVAEILGAPNIRMFSFVVPEGVDPASVRSEVMRRLEAFVEAAQGKSIKLLHENEKHIFGDVTERCVDIMETFKGAIRFTYDPSNFVQCGVDNAISFKALRPYIDYMHIKDSVYSKEKAAFDKGFDTVSDVHRPAGYGDGKVEWILRELVKSGWTGFASIEPHLTRNDAVPGTGADKFICAANALTELIAKISV